jgi:hypothetical protein
MPRSRWGHFIVGSPVKDSARTLFIHATPLLEKECHAGLPALAANFNDPFPLHLACTRPAFAASDNPVDSCQI